MESVFSCYLVLTSDNNVLVFLYKIVTSSG